MSLIVKACSMSAIVTLRSSPGFFFFFFLRGGGGVLPNMG